MIVIVYLIVTKFGFWYVETLVEMVSLRNLLDSVDDCVVLVDAETLGAVFVNKAAKNLKIMADGLASISLENGDQNSSYSLKWEAFARLDKNIFSNVLDY